MIHEHGTVGLVYFYGVHGATVCTSAAGSTRFFIELRNEIGGNEGLVAAIVSGKDGTAIVAAVADAILDIQAVNQPVLVALLQEFNQLIEGQFAGQTVFDGPAALVPRVDAGLQDVITMIAWIRNPVGKTARARGCTPVAFVSYGLGQVLRRVCIVW
jgi:hypothetical protein